MNTLLLMLLAFVGYIVAYNTYGRFLARRVFRLDPNAVPPSQALRDGVDYVPSRRIIVFGHHFTSIAGTGPIVGPAIGVIWGWVPAFIWVFLGSIVMGGVHDLGALALSLRNQGRSIADITGELIGPRVRLIFFLVVMLILWVVLAIFGLVMALIFARYPAAVIPIWSEIPIAVALGWLVYKRNLGGRLLLFDIAAILLMYVTIVIGWRLPVVMPAVLGMPATGVWTIILLLYAFVASVLPVTTLLQPRDYINAWELAVALALMVAGVLVTGLTGRLQIVAPAFRSAVPGAPSLWPVLFITIACGAISGFHSLVSSGTSSKQLSREPDALFVGYGAMLVESVLALLVIIACCAGIGMAYRTADGSVLTGSAAWFRHYASWGAAEGLGANLDAFVTGAANLFSGYGIPVTMGIALMGVLVASFAGTTLDTAARLQRYVVAELAGSAKLNFLANRWVASIIAVGSAGALAFATGATGAGALKLWPVFGALNQLLAGLALLVVTVWLRRRTKFYWLTLLPALFMMTMTSWALIQKTGQLAAARNWLLVTVSSVCLLLEAWMIVETFIVWLRPTSRAQESP
ncbi:MAG: carbon starvation protein A [candidate division WOR-3 bacterium]